MIALATAAFIAIFSVSFPLIGAAAARYVAIYMEAIRWENPANLYDRYSREG